jgi:hypothetical protein
MISYILNLLKSYSSLTNEEHKMNVEFTNWILKETAKDALKYFALLAAIVFIMNIIFM